MPCVYNSLYLDGRLYALAEEHRETAVSSKSSRSSISGIKTLEKELIITLKPLPWANKSALLNLVRDVSKITNALHFARHIDSVTLSGNNLIIKFSQPEIAEEGTFSKIVVGILALAALIFATGYLITGWKLADVQSQEVKLKQNALDLVKHIQNSNLPENVKKTYEQYVSRIATTTSKPPSRTPPSPPSLTSTITSTLVKAIAPVLSVVIIVILIVDLLPKLLRVIR